MTGIMITMEGYDFGTDIEKYNIIVFEFGNERMKVHY